ncbi:hypothetical protein HYH02_007698 [Chlamydomonas schloesseri]|uniref:SET domain-containing protein n=1 Tax=Chlamydomonas schloesseri TaxID=2026947 RepID=A0A835WH70_9CHLO|nr:hypothetical protein HYH02_007698 [Chlamydomonas schloesseri]|eukprot:KAG2447370.1 hypothetical protein HYH02_007698 [Chlamydomonas schloesseri]
MSGQEAGQEAGPGPHGHRAADISDEGDTFGRHPGPADGVSGELLEAGLCRSGPAASSLTTVPKALHGESGGDSSSALGRARGVMGSPILKQEAEQQEADQLPGAEMEGRPDLGAADADEGHAGALADDWVKQEAELGADAELAGEAAAAMPQASDEDAIVDDADPDVDPARLPHHGLSPVVDADDPDDDATHACGDDSAHRLRYLGAGAYRLPLGALPLFPADKVAMAAVEPTVITLWYQPAGEPESTPLRQHQAALRIYTYEHRKTVHITRMSGLAGRMEGVVTPHVGSTLGLWGLDDGRVMVGPVDVGPEAQDAAGVLAGGAAAAGHGAAGLGRGRHSHTVSGRTGLPPSGPRRGGAPGSRDRGLHEYGASGNSQQRAGGAGAGRSSTDGSAGGSAGGGISSAGGSARWTPQALENSGRRTMDGIEDMMGTIPAEWRVNARGPYRLTSFGGGTFGLPLSGLSVFPPAAVSAATVQPTTVTLWYMALSGSAAAAALGMEALQRYDAALRVYNYEHRRVAHLTRMKSLLDTIAGGAPATGGVLCLWRLADGRLLVTVAEAAGGGGAVGSGVGAGGSKASAGVAAGAAISGATSRRAAPSGKAKQPRGSKAAPSASEVGSLDDLPGAWEEELPDTATWALNAMAAAAVAPPSVALAAAAAAAAVTAPPPARSAPPRRAAAGRRRGRGASYEEDDDEADDDQEAHTRDVADEEGSEAAGSEDADDNEDGPKGSAGPRDLWFNGTGIYLPRDTANLLPANVRSTATEESAPLTLWFRAAVDGATNPDAPLRRFTRSRLRVSPSGSATISGSSEMVREVAGDMWDSSSKRLEMWLWRMEDGRCVVTQQHVPPPTQPSGWHLPPAVHMQTLTRRTQQAQAQAQAPAAASQAQALSQALLLHQQQAAQQHQQQQLLLLQRQQQLQWAQQQLSRAGLGRPPLGPRGQPGLGGSAAAGLAQQADAQDSWIGPQSSYVPPLGGLLRGLVGAGGGGASNNLNLPAASITHLHGFLPHGARLPPLQPGELRLCGLTFHPELAAGVRRAMAAWQASALARTRQEADAVIEQVEIPGVEPDPASSQAAANPTAQMFHRYGLSVEVISQQVAALLGLSAEQGWDAPLPAEGFLELNTQLVEPCQDVARGGAGLRAARRISRSTVLGVVAGYVMPAAVAARFVSQGYRHVNAAVRSQLEAEVAEVGMGDLAPAWQVLAGAFRLPVPGLEGELPWAAGGASSAAGHFNQPLELNMLGYGNLGALINDPRVEPRAWVDGNDVEDESGVAEMSANCAVLPVSVRGLLLPVLVTIRGVAPGEQLLRDYGAAWWRQLARPWEVLSVATEVAEARAGAAAATAAGGLAGGHAAAPVSSYEEAVARQARLQQQLHLQLQAAAAAARGGDMYTLDLGRQPATGKRQHPESGSRSVSPETQRRCL